MPRIAVNIVRFNQPLEMIRKCVAAALAQKVASCSVTLTENGSDNPIEGDLLSLFGDDPRFSYVDNGNNLGFAGAHNRFIAGSDAEIVVPLNPDAVLTPDYLQTLIGVFDHPDVGAATGKMLKGASGAGGSPILDGTGIMVSRGRRGRERGQNQTDANQFDTSCSVFGVSGTASAYRRTALEKIRLGKHEYFDEDFFAYWEDLDLSWRLRLAGYECVYVPTAVVYHARAVGQSKNGYHSPLEFIRHHRRLPQQILQWSWRNQLFCIVKNDFGWSLWRDLPFIVTRQTLMLLYVVIFETRTLGALPDFFRLLPRMLEKRRWIQESRVVPSTVMEKWFVSP